MLVAVNPASARARRLIDAARFDAMRTRARRCNVAATATSCALLPNRFLLEAWSGCHEPRGSPRRGDGPRGAAAATFWSWIVLFFFARTFLDDVERCFLLNFFEKLWSLHCNFAIHGCRQAGFVIILTNVIISEFHEIQFEISWN